MNQQEQIEFKELTGFDSVEEWNAYQLGQEHYGKTIFKYIENWDGVVRSTLGQALYDKFKELNERKTN